MEPPASKVSTPKRRFWPRFTLRVLLVFVTLVGVGLGFWTHWTNRARQQRRIVEQIEQGGGMVCYEREGPGAPEPRNFAVEWLATILSRDYLEGIVQVSLHNREAIPNLPKLHGLETIGIRDANLDDSDLTAIANCRDLVVLYIGDAYFFGDNVPKSQISDRSLILIARLPKLEIAHVHGTGFTRAGIEALAQSPTLRSLEIGLCDPSVVASDFDTIKGLGRVKSLKAWRGKEGELGFEEIIKW
jgi:hypothetical protein